MHPFTNRAVRLFLVLEKWFGGIYIRMIPLLVDFKLINA